MTLSIWIVPPKHMAQIVCMVEDGTISRATARHVMDVFVERNVALCAAAGVSAQLTEVNHISSEDGSTGSDRHLAG